MITLLLAGAVSAKDKKARYIIKIKVNTGERFIGEFISINDSTLTMFGPVKSMQKTFIAGKRNMDYRIIKADELSAVKINRANAPVWITGGGILAGFIVGGMIASQENNGFQSLSTMLVTGPLTGAVAGAVGSDVLSTKFKRRKMQLHNFSSIKDQLKAYEAK